MNLIPSAKDDVSEKQDATSVDSQRTIARDDADPQTSELSVRSILALTASALAYFTTVGFSNAYGVFQQYYTAHYLPNESNFQISWIGSFASFMVFAFAAPAGILADRFGPTIPICTGAVLQLVAIFMVSLCREYYQFFLAQGVLLGIGMSLIAIPTSTIVPMYFKRNRGLAQGVSIAGSSLGGVIWPIVMDQLLNHDGVSFGWSMRIIGFITIPLLALVILCLRRPKDYRGKVSPAETSEGEHGIKKKRMIPAAVRQAPFILLCLGLAASFFGFWDPLFYVSTYAVHIGTSETLSFYMLSILNGASLFGRILPGYLADRVGHFNMLTLSSLFSSVVAFAWTGANTSAGLVVWSILYGFVSGSILSLQLACSTLLGGSEGTGAAVGLTMASVSLCGLFGAPIAGELLQAGGYTALSTFAGGMLLLGTGLLWCARLARERRLWAKV